MSRILLLLAVTAALCHHAGVNARRHDGHTGRSKHRRRELIMGLRGENFDEMTPDVQNNTEIIAQVGSTASIKCYTHHLGEDMSSTQVSWLKRDEDHILTAGGQVYSSESRYSVSHVRHQKLWELSLRDVRLSDAGLYECQLTTHPPTSLFFTLKVVEARAVIQGAPEVHVQTGQKLRLHCSVEQATEPPVYIFWFHNGSMINYAPRRPLRVMKHNFASSLIINNVTWDDAGSYRCEPHMAEPANLTLHVVAGEKHAALHNGQNEGAAVEEPITPVGSSGSAPQLISPLLIAYLILIVGNHCFQTLNSRRIRQL